MRKSGIDIVGNIPWGTHLCQFYETGRDLTDVLVPYFKAGLKSNEFCLWVTSSPLSKAEAEKALKKAIPGFDRYVKKGQIEIIPHTKWYLKDDGFRLKRVLKGWVDKLEKALARGYEGMRVEGNLAWLGRKDWKNFIEYEEEINKVIGNLRMIAVCSYNLGKCSASDVIEVVNNHHFALIRRDGEWNVLENIHHRFTRQVMNATREQLALVVEASLDAIIAVDEAGNISLFNPAAEELFRYSLDEVLHQPVRVLLRDDVSEIHHQRLERFLRKGIGRCGHIGRRTEFTFRRKDGSFFDGELSMSGARVGGKRMIVVSIRDITERKRAEETLKISEERFFKIFNSSPNAILLSTIKDGRLLDINESGAKMFGWQRQEMVGRTAEELNLWINSGDRKTMLSILQENGIVRDLEIDCLRKSGEIFKGSISVDLIEINGEKILLTTGNDITERKRAEDILREKEEIYKGILGTSIDGFWIHDLQGNIRETNDACSRVLGYSRDELLKMKISDVVAVEKPEETDARIRKIVATGGDRFETKLRRKDGNVLDFEISVNFVDVSGGRLFVFSRDITERKQAEEMLRLSEEKYRNLFHNAQVGLFRTRIADGKVVECNDLFAEMLGYKSREECLRDYSVLRHFNNPDDQKRLLRKLKNDGEARGYEAKGIKVDGSPIGINYSVKMIPGTEYIEGASVDITDHWKLQEMIRHSALEWRTTLDAMPELVMLLDSQNKILRVNKAVCKMLDLTFKEIIGQPCYRVIHGTEAPPEHCPHQKAVTGKIECFNKFFEKKLNRHFEVGLIPLLDDDKNVISIVHILRDITDDLILQKKLRSAEKMAVIGEIAGNIAHEIKNPLFAISSGIEILHDQLKPAGAQKETLESILRETVRMDYLVRQLLDYGRRRALKEIAFAPVDMRGVIDEVVSLNSGLLQVNGIRIEMKIPPELPSVMAEKGEMIQVFINLLQNAIEVSKKGDVIEIEARADYAKKLLIISMKDRGPGILKEMKEKIFEIFFTTKKGSYGMGLAISKRIVLDHGGDIRVEDREGRGATFIVELPIK
jgi:PAS domain S-box-containing protein